MLGRGSGTERLCRMGKVGAPSPALQGKRKRLIQILMTCEKSKTYDLLFEKSEVSVPASYIIYCRDYPAAKVISKGNPKASSAQQGRFGKQFVGWICRQPLMKRHLVDLLRCHKSLPKRTHWSSTAEGDRH